MISVTLGDATTLFEYNGDGDRLSKAVNGTLTTYTLDVAAGLPQVLVEHSGENATLYLYGLDLIGEQGAAWAFFFLRQAVAALCAGSIVSRTGGVISYCSLLASSESRPNPRRS